MIIDINLGVLGDVKLVQNNFYWSRHNLDVIYDGFTEQGTRIIVVENKLNNCVDIIDNSIVISVDYLKLKLDQKNFKVFKLRHKETGLFYTPARYVKPKIEGYDDRYKMHSNLSAKGKTYNRRPPIPSVIRTHVPVSGMRKRADHCFVRTKETDWEIVGYE